MNRRDFLKASCILAFLGAPIKKEWKQAKLVPAVSIERLNQLEKKVVDKKTLNIYLDEVRRSFYI